MFKKHHLTVFLAVAVLFSHDACACCSAPEWTYTVQHSTVGNEPVVIVTVGPAREESSSQPFTDTLKVSGFRSRL